jgi:predicted membrane-bound spermidine synthase
MTIPRRGTLLLAGTLFMLSGALGLGYQLVWIRKATLIVGASQIALSTVLTSFFLGLALGSLAVGRYLRSRRFSPLFIYGLFEAGIGLYALAFPLLFGWIEASYGALYGIAASSSQALFLLRFALLFVLFLVPTFFMGGTLPLLLDGLVDRDASVGSLTSFFYGLNIIGAVIGVLLTSYFAIPHLGMNGTSLAAGVGNLSIAVLAIVAFRSATPLHIPAKAGKSVPGPGLFFSFLAVLSGLATIGYQIAWARYFSLFKTASVHLTAILLAVFLAALAAGSMIMARLLATGVRPLRIVALLQPLAAFIILYGLGWWRFADYTLTASNFEITPSWYFFSEVADTIFFAPLFQIGLVIFLPVTLLGTALPGIIAAATRNSAALRGTSGRLVFWNTIGASAGGFAAGYLLIPAFGLTGTLFTLTLFTLMLGAAAESRLVMAAARARRIPFGWGHGFTVLALIGAFLFLRDDVTRDTIRHHGVGKRIAKAKLVDLVEGPLTTGSVFSDPDNIYIAADDQILAVVRHGDLSVQAIEGHLPALFYPRPGTPKRVLGIAVGSGQSFGAMLRYPIEHMDIVDISTEMIQLAFEHFREFNCDLGNDPRVAVHLDDGRHFVERAAPESYDVISMEPPPPTAPGVHALYSLEFYQAAERVLREDGVIMQWLPLYWMTPNEARGIVMTQAAVFPQTFVLRMGQIDFVTMSFKRSEPPRFRTEWIEERAKIFAQEHEVLRKQWTSKCRHGTASLEGILALITTGPEDVARMNAPYIYRDDDQRLSYSSDDRQLLRRYHGNTLSIISFTALPITPFSRLQQYFADPIPVAELDEERARALLMYRVHSPAELAAAEVRYNMTADPAVRAKHAVTAAEVCCYEYEASLAWLGRAIESDPSCYPSWIDGWAHYHSYFHSRELRQWIGTLDHGARNSSIVESIENELDRRKQSENERCSSYLWHKLAH